MLSVREVAWLPGGTTGGRDEEREGGRDALRALRARVPSGVCTDTYKHTRHTNARTPCTYACTAYVHALEMAVGELGKII